MDKIALRIQSAEDEFLHPFIHLGPFYILLSYLKAKGKLIIGSGLVNIIVDSGILASGSVNTFLKESHFNRCKKRHPLLSLALQILHHEKFLEYSISSGRNILLNLEKLKEDLQGFNIVKANFLLECSKFL